MDEPRDGRAVAAIDCPQSHQPDCISRSWQTISHGHISAWATVRKRNRKLPDLLRASGAPPDIAAERFTMLLLLIQDWTRVSISDSIPSLLLARGAPQTASAPMALRPENESMRCFNSRRAKLLGVLAGIGEEHQIGLSYTWVADPRATAKRRIELHAIKKLLAKQCRRFITCAMRQVDA